MGLCVGDVLGECCSPVAVNRFVGNGILKLEVNNLRGSRLSVVGKGKGTRFPLKALGGYLGVRK